MGAFNHLQLFTAVLLDNDAAKKKELSRVRENTLAGAKSLLTELGTKQVLVCGEHNGCLTNQYPNAGTLGAIYSVLEYLIPANKNHRRTKTLKALLVLSERSLPLKLNNLQQLVHCGSEMHFSLRFDDQNFPLFLPLTEEIRDCAHLIAKSDNSSLQRFISCLGCASISDSRVKCG